MAGTIPTPVRLTVWLPPGALSVMLRAALRVPVAGGVKVTLIVQLAPAATELPQLLLCAKLLALVPVIASLVMLKVALPMFFRVTVCAKLVVPTVTYPSERLVLVRLATGVGLVAEKPTVHGADRNASAIIADKRIASFGLACGGPFACIRHASMLRPLPN
jgi:hypothetical protein